MVCKAGTSSNKDECTPCSRSITGLKKAYENFEAQFEQQSDGMLEYQSEFSRGAAIVLEMEAELRRTVLQQLTRMASLEVCAKIEWSGSCKNEVWLVCKAGNKHEECVSHRQFTTTVMGLKKAYKDFNAAQFFLQELTVSAKIGWSGSCKN